MEKINDTEMITPDIISIVDDFNNGLRVKVNGNSYQRGVNGYSFNKAVKTLPIISKIDSITVPLSSHQDYIGNSDLDADYHKGFTVGKGKVMYFMLTWHSSGTCTVYPVDSKINWPRNLTGNENITIHFNI